MLWNRLNHAYSKIVSQSAHRAANLPVGKSPAGVASLPVVSCWWFGVFQDALVGVTSRASYHQLSKSTAVLRLLWSDGAKK